MQLALAQATVDICAMYLPAFTVLLVVSFVVSMFRYK